MKKVLIMGCSGFIGSHLSQKLKNRFNVYGTFYRTPPKISNVPAFRFRVMPNCQLDKLLDLVKPDVVIWSLGLSAVASQRDPMGALYLNSEAPSRLASLMERSGGRLIYFSSAKVFSGDRGDYKETDLPDGRTNLGKTKARAEESLEHHSNVTTLRLGTIFGLNSYSSRGIVSQVIQNLQKGKSMRLISDEVQSWYSATQLADAVEKLINHDGSTDSLYHLGGTEKHSFYTLARKIAEVFVLKENKCVPITGRDFAKETKNREPRSGDLTLNGESFARKFAIEPESLEGALKSLKKRMHFGEQ